MLIPGSNPTARDVKAKSLLRHLEGLREVNSSPAPYGRGLRYSSSSLGVLSTGSTHHGPPTMVWLHPSGYSGTLRTRDLYTWGSRDPGTQGFRDSEILGPTEPLGIEIQITRDP